MVQYYLRNLFFFSKNTYKEGYDLPDEEYMKWLCENHPEIVADCFIGSNDDNKTSTLSITDAFSDIPVALPVTYHCDV